MLRLFLILSALAFAQQQPLSLEKTFLSVLPEEARAELGEKPPLEKLVGAMKPEQKLAARRELEAAEKTADAESLREIARGYQMLDKAQVGPGFVRIGTRLQELEPENPEGSLLAAKGASQIGDYPAAAEWARKTLALDPKNRQAQELYAFSYGRTPKSGAQSSIPSGTPGTSQAAVSGPGTSPQALSLAQKAADARLAGDVDAAWSYVQAAMNADPKSPMVQELYSSAKAERDKALKRKEFVPALLVDKNQEPDPPPSPFWPLAAGVGLTALGYGVARSRGTFSQTEDVGHQVEVDSEDDARMTRHAKALGISAAIAFGLVYGTAYLAPIAVQAFRAGGARLTRVASSEVGAINPGKVGTAAGNGIWSTGKPGNPVANAMQHWRDHGAEFPELRNAKEYVDAAWKFIKNPPPGTLSKVRVATGDRVFYHPSSNTFVVRTANGIPRTMFKPNPSQHGFPTNLDYFNAQ